MVKDICQRIKRNLAEVNEDENGAMDNAVAQILGIIFVVVIVGAIAYVVYKWFIKSKDAAEGQLDKFNKCVENPDGAGCDLGK